MLCLRCWLVVALLQAWEQLLNIYRVHAATDKSDLQGQLRNCSHASVGQPLNSQHRRYDSRYLDVGDDKLPRLNRPLYKLHALFLPQSRDTRVSLAQTPVIRKKNFQQCFDNDEYDHDHNQQPASAKKKKSSAHDSNDKTNRK